MSVSVRTIVISLFFIIVIPCQIKADVHYDDGQIHDINVAINDSVEIYNADAHTGAPTTVNLISGGVIQCSSVDVYDSSFFNLNTGSFANIVNGWDHSQVNISGGRIFNLATHANSRVIMTGGQIDRLDPFGNSTVDITGGSLGVVCAMENSQVTVSNASVEWLYPELRQNSSLSLTNTSLGEYHSMDTYDNSHFTLSTGTSLDQIRSFGSSTATISGGSAVWISAYANSRVTMTGGQIECLDAFENSIVDMTGGHVENLGAWGDSAVNITGGSLTSLDAYENGCIDIFGGEFYGIYTNGSGLIKLYGTDFNYNYGFITDMTGTLTGTLASGDFIQINFFRYNDGAILLVPEPATLLLLGLGGIALIKKRN